MWLKKIDNFCETNYVRIKSSFCGKVFLKIIADVVLALLIAVTTYFGQVCYNNMKMEKEENKKITSLYVSVSDEYINEVFGVPYVSVNEDEFLINNFYLLDKAVLRTVSENGTVVAYFITSCDLERRILIDHYDLEKQFVGEVTYSEIKAANPISEAHFDTNGRYMYYSEVQGTGRYGMYNYYVIGTVPYGYYDEKSYELIEKLEIHQNKDIQDIRLVAKPNTFGVISDGYEEKIKVLPICDEWGNICHLLGKNWKTEKSVI